MKKKALIILPIIFICISALLIYQSRGIRNDYRETLDSSESVELSAFEELQKASDKELVDLGEALISFVHFEDANVATITTKKEELSFSLTVVDRASNQFQLDTLKFSPDKFLIGDSFGLASDELNNYYYYSLD
ncbi:hypothetical protein D932_02470 [Enterococcus casseliflavus 14-MB-W-14]|uniref:hypothetical protein n=1 Tax=Enterococcus casseliflavus TaxID=37734 RepID=UPI000353EDDC|nr:hypothetical protein [Enterococcus casseliflavus]EPH62572.1 hypothetical protein D932_02470 [Enterococcus casseliflavus 14-MB-W-14]NKD39774.1 hypothetical protein [Enterococcus casseliflavus]